MTEERSRFKFLLYGILLVVLLFGMVRIFVSGSGRFFALELVGFVILIILSFIGFIGYAKPWGERVLFFTFLLYMINLALLWYFNGSLYLVLLFLALFGFILSLPKQGPLKSRVKKTVSGAAVEEPHSMVFDEPKETVSRPVARKGTTEKSVKYSPGKYVASKSSNVYHEPKCDWAKRIHKSRQVWFDGKEQAWEKGYKKHSCVE